MTTIEHLRAHKFVGTDYDVFKVFDNFIHDENNTLADRAEALYVMGVVGMGLAMSEFDPRLPIDYKPGVNADLDRMTVEQYIEETKDMSI